MIKKSAALIVFFGLFLFSSFVHGQDNRIVYPQVSIGPVPQQCDSLDYYPYFGEYSGLLILGPCDIQIELRLGNFSSDDEWNGQIRLLSKANLTQSLDIDIMDGDGTYLSEYLGAYEVNIPARGSSVYRISSRTFQRGVLVIEATESRITNLTTSFFFKPRNRNGTVSDLIAVQPATTPSHYFRAMVCGTNEGDEPFANLESGIAVVPASALSGALGAETEVTLKVIIDDDEPYEGTINIENEQKTVMLREVIGNLPDSFKTGQLSLVADEPVYASMIGIGSRPGFLSTQYASAPAQPAGASWDQQDLPPGQFQSEDLLIGFTTEFDEIWNDRGSGATLDGSMWRPKIPGEDNDKDGVPDLEGFHLVGDLAKRGYRAPQAAIVLVKDAYGDYCAEDGEPGCSDNDKLECSEASRFVGDAWKQPALCPPIKLEVVWQAKYFTGLVWIHNVSTVLPIAPEGYRCLGLIAIPRSEDHLANVLLAQYRCVREDLVVPTGFTQTEDDKGNVSDYHIWNPSGAHAQYYPEDFFAIGIAAPTLVEPGVAAIAPGTFSGQSDTEGNPSHSLNPVPLPWALQIPISEEHTGIKYPPLPPLLTDYSPPSPFNDETITSEVTLPWFAVRDPDLNSVSQLVLSPEYTLIRTVAFKLLQWSHNRTEVTQEIQWSFTEGVFHSRKDEFNWTTKVDIGGEWGVKDALQFKVNISQSFSYTLESVWGWDKSTTFTIPVKIPPGRAVVAYQLQSHYRLIRKDGTQLSVTVPFGRDTIIFDQYPSAQNSDGSKTDRIILKDAFSRAE